MFRQEILLVKVRKKIAVHCVALGNEWKLIGSKSVSGYIVSETKFRLYYAS